MKTSVSSRSRLKVNYGRADPASFRRRIRPIRNERGFGQYRADHFSLHANALAVDDSHDAKAGDLSFPEVFLYHHFHISGRDGMKIKNIRDGNRYRFGKRIERIDRIKLIE